MSKCIHMQTVLLSECCGTLPHGPELTCSSCDQVCSYRETCTRCGERIWGDPWKGPKTVLTTSDVLEILRSIRYRDWHFRLEVDDSGKPDYIQVQFHAPDNDNPAVDKLHSGRKWRISQHMTKSEVVQTALKAVLTAEEHEAREQFRYNGQAIFGPHISVDVLWIASRNVDVRPEPEVGK